MVTVHVWPPLPDDLVQEDPGLRVHVTTGDGGPGRAEGWWTPAEGSDPCAFLDFVWQLVRCSRGTHRPPRAGDTVTIGNAPGVWGVVRRVARDGSWADVLWSAGRGSWSKRQTRPDLLRVHDP